jgi:hypothetical protein
MLVAYTQATAADRAVAGDNGRFTPGEPLTNEGAPNDGRCAARPRFRAVVRA